MTKTCAICATAPAKVFCCADEAYLCAACDRDLHSVAPSQHERHFLCAMCDGHAKVWCRNDQAYLCTACDADVHATNPLAARHERVPVQAIACEDAVNLTTASSAIAGVGGQAAAPVGSSPAALSDAEKSSTNLDDLVIKLEPELVAVKACKDLDAFELDGCLFDFGFDFTSFDDMLIPGSPSDGVVPVMPEAAESATSSSSAKQETQQESLSSDFAFNPSTFSSPYAPSPDPIAALSMPVIPSQPTAPAQLQTMQPQQQMQQATRQQQPGFDVPTDMLHVIAQEKPLDRKERVMRYREKRKRRTFEKTIRYHSRKAYAEIRPRIKGRFATKEEVEVMKAAAAVAAAAPMPVAGNLTMPPVFTR